MYQEGLFNCAAFVEDRVACWLLYALFMEDGAEWARRLELKLYWLIRERFSTRRFLIVGYLNPLPLPLNFPCLLFFLSGGESSWNIEELVVSTTSTLLSSLPSLLGEVYTKSCVATEAFGGSETSISSSPKLSSPTGGKLFFCTEWVALLLETLMGEVSRQVMNTWSWASEGELRSDGSSRNRVLFEAN